MPCPFCNANECTPSSSSEVVCSGCGHVSQTARWGKVSKKRGRETYELGSHGAKGREQKRVKTAGSTHESEHTVGFEVFGDSVDRGKSTFARKIENQAAAYQESKPAHRGHIGTGNWKNYRGTGASSGDYRRDQRALVGNNQVGNAVQLNQLHYAFQPEFRDPSAKGNLAKADSSYEKMVENFPATPFRMNDQWIRVPVNDTEKAEMMLARAQARTGTNVSRQQELAAMAKFGIKPGQLEENRKTPVLNSYAVDQHGIPKDGNCLFHSIWSGLHANGANVGFLTNDDLRRQAVGFLRFDPDVQALNAAGTGYLLAMGQSGTWGGELEAMALAHVWGVKVVVHGPQYTITYNQNAQSPLPIHLYYNGNSHYSVGPI